MDSRVHADSLGVKKDSNFLLRGLNSGYKFWWARKWFWKIYKCFSHLLAIEERMSKLGFFFQKKLINKVENFLHRVRKMNLLSLRIYFNNIIEHIIIERNFLPVELNIYLFIYLAKIFYHKWLFDETCRQIISLNLS